MSKSKAKENKQSASKLVAMAKGKAIAGIHPDDVNSYKLKGWHVKI